MGAFGQKEEEKIRKESSRMVEFSSSNFSTSDVSRFRSLLSGVSGIIQIPLFVKSGSNIFHGFYSNSALVRINRIPFMIFLMKSNDVLNR